MNELSNEMHSWISFWKAHEKIIIVVLVVAATLTIGDKALLMWEHHDQRVYDQDKARVANDAAVNAISAKNNLVLAQQYADLVKTVEASFAQREREITARAVATKQQQAQDLALPAPALATRWEQLAELPVGSVTLVTGAFQITDGAARKTVQQLEDLSRLKADIVAVRQESADKDAQVGKQGEVITGLRTELTGVKKELTDEQKSHHDEVALVRAQARRSKFKIAIIAYVAGYLTRDLTKALGY